MVRKVQKLGRRNESVREELEKEGKEEKKETRQMCCKGKEGTKRLERKGGSKGRAEGRGKLKNKKRQAGRRERRNKKK